MNDEFADARRNRAYVATGLRSGRHVQLRYGKGDYQNPREPVCFAHAAKRELHIMGVPLSTTRNNENRGTRKALGLSPGDYNKLVQMNDRGVPFNIMADVLERMPYRRSKSLRGPTTK